MKIKLDKKNIEWGITAFLVLAAGALVVMLGTHLSQIFGAVRMVFTILSPIIYGLIIAYLLNPVMKFLEEKVILGFICEKLQYKPSEKVEKIIRLISVVLSLLFMVACIYGLLALLVPQLVNSIINLTNSFPRYVTTVRQYMMRLFQDDPELESNAVQMFEKIAASMENWINNSFLPKINEIMATFSSQLIDILSVIKNFLIGSIISIYFLNGREGFIARGKRILYAMVGEPEMANNILRDLRYVNRTFGGFFLGKIIDSAIIGVICYVCTSILTIPYALLVSVIVGITNIIPFFGPFIGAVPSIFILLIISPLQALIFAVFILVLQQVDGNIIGPRIIGDSVGLSSLWIMFAIIVGGAYFGVAGMILGVPVFSVIYTLLRDFVNKRLEGDEEL